MAGESQGREEKLTFNQEENDIPHNFEGVSLDSSFVGSWDVFQWALKVIRPAIILSPRQCIPKRDLRDTYVFALYLGCTEVILIPCTRAARLEVEMELMMFR